MGQGCSDCAYLKLLLIQYNNLVYSLIRGGGMNVLVQYVCLYTITVSLLAPSLSIILFSLLSLSCSFISIPSQHDLEHNREINKGEGELLARDWQCSFFETSAKDRINIDETFQKLVKEMKRFLSADEDKVRRRMGCVVM